MVCSCGHNSDILTNLNTMDFSIDFDSNEMCRAVRYGSYCEDCSLAYHSFGVVLETADDERKWLDGVTEYPVIDIHA